MDDLTFDQLRKANVDRCNDAYHPIEDWTPTDWACAAAGEMGEACNLIKKARRKDYVISDRERTEIGFEIADTVVYLDLLAARMGIDLGAAVRSKFNVVSNRFGCKIKL